VTFEGDYFGVISIVVSPTESADGAAKRKVRQKSACKRNPSKMFVFSNF